MRGGCRQLNSERNLTLVAQNAQLHGAILIFALRREFFAKLAGGTDTLAVERDDDIACFHAGLFRSRTGVDIAYEYSLAIGSAEKCAELSVDFRHHVIFLEAGLGRGTVRNDLSQDHAALG